MFSVFCILSALAFMFICFLWSTSDFKNTFVKVFFGAMTLWAVVCSLIQLGFLK